VAGQYAVADRVDAAVDRVQATPLHAVLDDPAAQPERLELAASDDAVLSRGEIRDRSIRSTFATTMGVNVERMGHAAIVPKQSRRRNRGIASQPCQIRAPLTRGRRVG
jgi:hypothetical protein